MIFHKEIFVTSSQSQWHHIRNILEENGIHTDAEVNGIGDPGRYHGNLHAGFQKGNANIYYIYVSRKDYSRAKYILESNASEER